MKKINLLLTSTLLGTLLLGTFAPPAHAKNVFLQNHPDLEWYTIETEHFSVHYPVSRKKEGNDHYLSAEWTAKKAAKVAEEMWPRMCAEFDYYLKEKVNIVILDQSDELEGFTVPAWDWIEISANPGGDFYRQRGRMEWLTDVLVHEFAHVVSLKANGTLAEGAMYVGVGGLYTDGVVDQASGADLYVMENDPFFWTEGGAEYYSDQAGYNTWTPSRDMHVRTTVLDGRLLSYDEWTTRQQTFSWGDGERGYQQGYSFALYLRQRFGPETYQELALENAEHWRLDWLSTIEAVTGVPGEQLYNDWVAYITEKYEQQYDGVKALGAVAGRELATAPYDWEYTDPERRDAFLDHFWSRRGVSGEDLARMDREKAREATGRYQMVARYSDDGAWYGNGTWGTVAVERRPETSFTAFGGRTDAAIEAEAARNHFAVPNNFLLGWDFVAGEDALVVSGTEHLIPSRFTYASGVRFEGDGYDWKQLWYIPLPVGEREEKKLHFRGYKEREHTVGVGTPPDTFAGARPIPNTLRGSEPSVSPDGKKVAYLEYRDGTMNLVTIALDGSDKKYLTTFDDGTWMQRCDWSPDGKQVVVAIFRNFQQDLYVLDADGDPESGSEPRPIMYDRWEDADPYWAPDGKIYFSSEPTGIFNIYAWDPESRSITQITNVIGGAEAPSITPSGNLVYNAYTGFGWKVYGVKAEDFLNRDVTADFRLDANPAAVKEAWAFREDLSAYVPEEYHTTLMAPAGVPLIRFSNNSLDQMTMQAGAVAFVQDYTEDHYLYLEGLLGSDLSARVAYTWSGWYPSITVGALHAEYKLNSGYLLDEDGDTGTIVDQSVYELRNQQYVNYLYSFVELPWNDRFSMRTIGSVQDLGFRSSTDSGFERYKVSMDGSLGATFTNIGRQAAAANPRGGRNIDLTYTHGFTDVVYAAYGGKTVDDGEILDDYHYEKVEGRWTEQIRMPTWGWLPELLTAPGRRNHTLQVDLAGGVISRNVDGNDEFRGGGQHPYYFGSDSLRPNTFFAGYPAYSLSGETMAVLNLAYRFPLRRELNWKAGPLYVYDITAQVMGTAGNLWSFRAPDDPDSYYHDGSGSRVARDVTQIRREIPLVDDAYKNGNSLLYDAGAELRVSSSLFAGAGWNSFLRVVYGFNEINGYGDVDGNDVQDTTDNAISDQLSNETEKPGVRVYVGLGTGW